MCISKEFPSAEATTFGELLSWRLPNPRATCLSGGGVARVAPFPFPPAYLRRCCKLGGDPGALGLCRPIPALWLVTTGPSQGPE